MVGDFVGKFVGDVVGLSDGVSVGCCDKTVGVCDGDVVEYFVGDNDGVM